MFYPFKTNLHKKLMKTSLTEELNFVTFMTHRLLSLRTISGFNILFTNELSFTFKGAIYKHKYWCQETP